MDTLEIGAKYLTLDDFRQVLIQAIPIKLSREALHKMSRSFEFLKHFSKDKIVYGVNTGFGPMAQYLIDSKDAKALQYNLIRSHAAGSGHLLPDICLKATLFARLNSLLQGYSGIHSQVVFLLKDCINHDVLPCIYEHGGVGASGDLVQLAHVALSLIGEGEVRYKEQIQTTRDVFKKQGWNPIQMHLREGLALLNGTSAMTGIGLVNLLNINQLVSWSTLMTAMILEIVSSYDDYFSKELNAVKRHVGQQYIAEKLRRILQDSRLLKKRYSQQDNSSLHNSRELSSKVQEYYSLRCVPQVLGPIWDTLQYAEKILLDEVNAANDNPIIDAENENIYHGGNFHGDYVALEMDKIRIAVTKLSMLCERQLNFLMNDKLNGQLPPFLNIGKLGLNFGLQGVQFTATSTVAENQTLANPIYTHSISTNKDNQDVVSMGANAAQLTFKVIENTFEILAIEMMAIIQAIDYLGIVEKMATTTKSVFYKLKPLITVGKEDIVRQKEIKNIKDFLKKEYLQHN